MTLCERLHSLAMLKYLRDKYATARRGLRRLKARWRLHRIEWNAMHAPMEPPPGYESYATMREAVPAFSVFQEIHSWSDFKTRLRKAWKLYKHDYFPDPELVAEEERAENEHGKMVDELEEQRAHGRRIMKRDVLSLYKYMKAAAPKDTKELGGRLDILQEAIDQFSLGYSETSSGITTLFGIRSYHPDIIEPDNHPVVYRVDEDSLDNMVGREEDVVATEVRQSDATRG